MGNNYASSVGGGVALGNGGGALGAIVGGCYFYGNLCPEGLGGACRIVGWSCIISNCIAINNSASSGGTAGAFELFGGTGHQILNCSIISNSAGNGGGIGVLSSSSVTIKYCSIVSNSSAANGGGIYATGVLIRDCLIARNSSSGSSSGQGGGVYLTNGAIESCTVVSNYAAVSGGGLYIAGPDSSGTNNIIYFNTAPSSANFTNTAGNTGLQYSCVIPAVDGARNITNDPSLVNLSGNYRLNDNSPCVNAGLNQSWMTNTVDLDGRQRIRYGTVDMGAFEGICGGTIYGFH